MYGQRLWTVARRWLTGHPQLRGNTSATLEVSLLCVALPVLLAKDHFATWCAVDPSVWADDSGTLTCECVLLLVNQASFGLDLLLYPSLGLEVGHNDPAADVAILQYVVIQASQTPEGIKLG
jgi:hypothetical protein